MDILLIINLFILGLMDLKYFRIPNKIIFYGIIYKIIYICFIGTIPISVIEILLFLVIFFGIIFILNKFIRVPSGDVKLFLMIFLYLGVDKGLYVIFLSMVFSFVFLAVGNRKVPIATMTFIGYITYLFFNFRGILWKKIYVF